jgi:alkylation response protein AidB-like acyl-CoA dehydrogenase
MVHGARGYVSEFELERNLRDAIGGLVYSGTSDIQRNIVARLLGVG